MVANMGPADYNYDETLSTLRYACAPPEEAPGRPPRTLARHANRAARRGRRELSPGTPAAPLIR